MGLVPITNLAIPSFLAHSVVLLLYLRTVASFQRLHDPARCQRSFFHIYAARMYPGQGCADERGYASAVPACRSRRCWQCISFTHKMKAIHRPQLPCRLCQPVRCDPAQNVHFRIIAGIAPPEEAAASSAAVRDYTVTHFRKDSNPTATDKNKLQKD